MTGSIGVAIVQRHLIPWCLSAPGLDCLVQHSHCVGAATHGPPMPAAWLCAIGAALPCGAATHGPPMPAAYPCAEGRSNPIASRLSFLGACELVWVSGRFFLGNGRASLALPNSSEKLLALLWFEENKYPLYILLPNIAWPNSPNYAVLQRL